MDSVLRSSSTNATRKMTDSGVAGRRRPIVAKWVCQASVVWSASASYPVASAAAAQGGGGGGDDIHVGQRAVIARRM